MRKFRKKCFYEKIQEEEEEEEEEVNQSSPGRNTVCLQSESSYES